MRPGWMRPSCISRSRARRATSRRTGSKHESSTAPGRVVDDQVDAGGGLEGADVAALAADDAPLHVVVGEVHDRHRALDDVVGGDPLDGQRDDPLARALASWLASSSMRRMILAASMRASFSIARISSALACSEVRPAIRSSCSALLGDARPPARPPGATSAVLALVELFLRRSSSSACGPRAGAARSSSGRLALLEPALDARAAPAGTRGCRGRTRLRAASSFSRASMAASLIRCSASCSASASSRRAFCSASACSSSACALSRPWPKHTTGQRRDHGGRRAPPRCRSRAQP